jgi:hypothetical protein
MKGEGLFGDLVADGREILRFVLNECELVVSV